MPPKNKITELLSTENNPVSETVNTKKCHITVAQLKTHTVPELIIAYMYGTLRDINMSKPVGERVLDNRGVSEQFVDAFTSIAHAIMSLQSRIEPDAEGNVINDIYRVYHTFNLEETLASIVRIAKEKFDVDFSKTVFEVPSDSLAGHSIDMGVVEEYFKPVLPLIVPYY